MFQKSILGGVRWIVGKEKGGSKPNPELSAAQEKLAKDIFEAAQK